MIKMVFEENNIMRSLILIVILLLTFPIPGNLYGFNYVIFAAVPVFYVLNNIGSSLKCTKYHLYLFILCVYMLCSSLWAQNHLTALNDFFFYSTCLSWIYILEKTKDHFLITQVKRIFYLVLATLFTYQFILLVYNFFTLPEFNYSKYLKLVLPIIETSDTFPSIDYKYLRVFGYNSNVLGMNVLLLMTILLFNRSREIIFYLFTFISLLLIATITFYGGSKGTFLIFFYLLIVYMVSKKKMRVNKKIIIAVLLIIFILLSIFLLVSSARILLARNSLLLFAESPLFGIGAGQSEMMICKYGCSDIVGLNFTHVINRVADHCSITKFLAEFGILGFILITLSIYKVVVNLNSNLRYIGILCISVLFISSLFYKNALSFSGYFSTPFFITLVYSSINLNGEAQITVHPIVSVILKGLSIISLLWFSVNIYSNIKMKAYSFKEKTETNINNRLQFYKKSLKYYHESIEEPLNLARDYVNLNRIDDAEEHFKLTLKLNPYNDKALYAYSHFLLFQKFDVDNAQTYLNRLLRHQSNFEPALLLNLYIKYINGNIDEVLRLIDNPEFEDSYYEILNLKVEIIKDPLQLKYIIHLTEDQQSSLMKVSKSLNPDEKLSNLLYTKNNKNASKVVRESLSVIKLTDSILTKKQRNEIKYFLKLKNY